MQIGKVILWNVAHLLKHLPAKGQLNLCVSFSLLVLILFRNHEDGSAFFSIISSHVNKLDDILHGRL